MCFCVGGVLGRIVGGISKWKLLRGFLNDCLVRSRCIQSRYVCGFGGMSIAVRGAMPTAKR